jgi:lipase ATG15
MPHYGICDLEWAGLSAVDFSILSELAYFDEDDGKVGKIQNMVDSIFPDLDFQATLSERKSSGPMYLEITSLKLNLTVISIRGTDIGRMNDFMEDIKLYAEPIIFTLLSTVFPTIRLWSTDTTSKVIEWLFQFNAFFG